MYLYYYIYICTQVLLMHMHMSCYHFLRQNTRGQSHVLPINLKDLFQSTRGSYLVHLCVCV